MGNEGMLGEFLRSRRERSEPLPGGPRRRTPGLRREEVAELANISTVYYERLEQGRVDQPSAAVLAGLSAALGLTDDERTHLHRLAGQSVARAVPADGYLDPSLEYVLREVESTTPAFMTDDLGDVIAQNVLNRLMFGDFTQRPGRGRNLIWQWFTSASWRHTLEPAEQHEQTGLAYVADLRIAVSERGPDSDAELLVKELLTASDEFRRMWDQHAVESLHCAAKVVHDERVGRLDLDCVILTSALSRQRLLLLKPVPGTPSRDRLGMLATYS